MVLHVLCIQVCVLELLHELNQLSAIEVAEGVAGDAKLERRFGCSMGNFPRQQESRVARLECPAANRRRCSKRIDVMCVYSRNAAPRKILHRPLLFYLHLRLPAFFVGASGHRFRLFVFEDGIRFGIGFQCAPREVRDVRQLQHGDCNVALRDGLA